MNSVFNGKIDGPHAVQATSTSREPPDDSGTSVGAALWLAQRTGREADRPMSSHNYWGPEYTDARVPRRRRSATSSPARRSSTTRRRRAAKDLVDGKIVGWFQGRMEFGQRALGNRSILLDPRRTDGTDVVNAAVKFREAFRPFAPAILADRVQRVVRVRRRHARAVHGAGVHVPSGEAQARCRRSSTSTAPAGCRRSTADDNPRYHALIERFDRADRCADRAQHQLQPERRADRLLTRGCDPHVLHVRARRALPGQRTHRQVAQAAPTLVGAPSPEFPGWSSVRAR